MKMLPRPWLSLAILGLWLTLASSFTINSLLLGIAFAIAIPAATRQFWPNPPKLHRPVVALSLAALVCRDIILANFQLARQILGPLDGLKPALVAVPLDIEDPFVATILASIVSLTPGTVSIDVDVARRCLTVHVFNMADEGALISTIKQRYEAPLKAIFAC